MKENIDIELLEQFFQRMGMYIHPISRGTIISFVTGYESGKKSDYFTSQISNHLKTKYGIEKPAVGYPYQIEVYSKRHDLSWVEGFIRVSKEVMSLEHNDYSKTKFDENILSRDIFLEQVLFGKKIFENIELENLDLRNEKLTGLSFLGCFISSDFRNADLSNTKFINGNVKTSDFRHADLTNSTMENISFESTKFKGAIIKGFVFKDNYCYSEDGIGQDDFIEWICETE